MISRDSSTLSPWQQANLKLKPQTDNHEKHQLFDVMIIGAGITGLTTAYLLQKRGKKCIVLENSNIGFGTTGGTSAHLNTFFDATYPEIESNFGEKEAKMVADAGKEAFSFIKKAAKELTMQYDLEEKDAFLFAQDDNGGRFDLAENVLCGPPKKIL